ncbi:MAG TPA: helix-turn-helix domain-containing protein, partial [Methanocella sp.]
MSVSDWKEREKGQRCNDILDAAMKLFYAKGYDDVSMSDIAAQVGIKKPTLYLYFRNKEALFFAVVARGERIRNAMAREEAGKCRTGKEKFGAATRVLAESNGKYPEYTWAGFFLRSGRFDLEHPENNPDIKTILELQGEFFDILVDGLRSGMTDGAYLADVDPLSMAVLLAVIAESASDLRPDYRYVIERGGVGN